MTTSSEFIIAKIAAVENVGKKFGVFGSLVSPSLHTLIPVSGHCCRVVIVMVEGKYLSLGVEGCRVCRRQGCNRGGRPFPGP